MMMQLQIVQELIDVGMESSRMAKSGIDATQTAESKSNCLEAMLYCTGQSPSDKPQSRMHLLENDSYGRN
jgi:hypothetical protein